MEQFEYDQYINKIEEQDQRIKELETELKSLYAQFKSRDAQLDARILHVTELEQKLSVSDRALYLVCERYASACTDTIECDKCDDRKLCDKDTKAKMFYFKAEASKEQSCPDGTCKIEGV